MRIYKSLQNKKYYIVSDKTTIEMLDYLEKNKRTVTVKEIAAYFYPNRSSRGSAYYRLKKLEKKGLIKIEQHVNSQYIIPTFKKINILTYSYYLSILLLAVLFALLLHPNRDIYYPLIILLFIIYLVIFLKERSILQELFE